MEKYAIKHDKALTESAKSIFGDIVSAAYLSIERYSFSENKDLLMDLKEKKLNIELGRNLIEFNGESQIAIRFTNGNIVKFEVSEWGHIKNISGGNKK